jgi:sarcosine/dimethylglycine N-methyltransferase
MINSQIGADRTLTFLRESYLGVSVPDEPGSSVISMDALLHWTREGAEGDHREAAHVLRPGGWMIFSDIMQQERVDPVEIQPVMHPPFQLGTLSRTTGALAENGFHKFQVQITRRMLRLTTELSARCSSKRRVKIPVSEGFF